MAGGVSRGLQEALKDLVDTNVRYASLGIIESVEVDDRLGYLLNVNLSPSGVDIQARPLFSDTGNKQGAFFPFEAGQEVLVIMPDGDPNMAVALGGLPSLGASLPSSFANDTPQVVHPNGFEVRSSEGEAVDPVVRDSLLADLQTSLKEITAILKAGPVSAVTPTTDAFVAKLPTFYRTNSLKSSGN